MAEWILGKAKVFDICLDGYRPRFKNHQGENQGEDIHAQ